LEQWLENEPVDYAYTVSKSAFISPAYTGPYRFEVRDNQTDTIYFDIENTNFEPENLFEGWDDFEQVKEFSTGFEIANLFESCEPYRTTFKLLDDGREYLIVHLIKSTVINIQSLQAITSYGFIYVAISFYLSKVSYSPE